MAFKVNFAVVLVMLVACAFSTPARLSTATRQEGFVFQTGTDTAAVGTETNPAVASAPEPASEAPPMPAEPEVSPEEAGESMFSAYNFAYNVGGGAHGDFQADPTEWIVADGDTAAFEIPEAPVVGAVTEPLDIYKSHRYGPNAITWGYDIAVEHAGIYTCTLHYAETYSEFFTEEPNRTFKVEISGDGTQDAQEASFDIMVELGGAEFTAYRRTFENIEVINTLSIRETPSLGDAFLSGISCEYVSPIALA